MTPEPVLEPDIVESAEEAARLSRPPLLILQPVRELLDAHGLGSGALRAERVGTGGGSNFSFLLERGSGERFVLRRPPRPPLPPSAHDVVREARLQMALGALGIRVPTVRAVWEEPDLIGVPFSVSEFLEGDVVSDVLPPWLGADPQARRSVGEDLVDALVEIHAVDPSARELVEFVRPGNYLERQLRRFTDLWGRNATRELPLVDDVGSRLAAAAPAPLPDTVVHGDYRLGNTIVAAGRVRPIVAVLDWEMGAIGDPRADLGYLLATYSEPGGEPSPLGTSPVTATEGFPTRRQLVSRYVERSGRSLDWLDWFEALALWKAAIFCEAIYGRYRSGELTAADAAAAHFEAAVPAMAAAAASRLATLGV